MKEQSDFQSTEDSRAEPEGLSRRAFCRRAGATTAALAVAGALAGGDAAARRLDETPERRIEGAELLMLGYAMTFRYPSERDLAILVRTRDGRYLAYTQNCTHQGCPVNFERAHDRLECPCHQGAYDLQTGEHLFGPPRLPLTRINLELRRGGEVWAVGKG
jgi:arsenite oxidase small subunit